MGQSAEKLSGGQQVDQLAPQAPYTTDCRDRVADSVRELDTIEDDIMQCPGRTRQIEGQIARASSRSGRAIPVVRAGTRISRPLARAVGRGAVAIVGCHPG
jgi:hypothetical protein